jgi:hypothetical protein
MTTTSCSQSCPLGVSDAEARTEVVSWWHGPPLALALDATTQRQMWVLIAVVVVIMIGGMIKVVFFP